jgi:hypothetical protein
LGVNPLSATNNSNVITVTDPNASGYAVLGAMVTLSGATAFAGLTNAELSGTFQITSVVDSQHYQVTLAPKSVATATATGGGSGIVYQADVATMTLNMFDDNQQASPGQTLPQTQGYVQPVIYDTSNGPFVAPQTSTGAPNLSLILAFNLGQLRPDPAATVKIGFYTGQSGGLAQFNYVTIPSSSSGSQALYQTWLYNNGNNGSFSAVGGASPTGSILQLNGLPYAGINWYQIQISEGSTSRTYNFYANAVQNQGLLNPAFNGQANSLAIDGLAQIPLAPLPPPSQQYLTSLNISAFSGGTLSMDPSLLQLITDQSVITSNLPTWPQPDAPVLGTLAGSTFSNWGGSTTVGTPDSNLNNVTTGSLAFGWQGSDQTWISYNAFVADTQTTPNHFLDGYTNKVSGLDVVRITFTSSSGPVPAPISITSDIDGKWTESGTSNFGAGTYTAIMQEFLPTDTMFTTPVNNPSQPLTFNVVLDQLHFAGTGGNFLQLDPGKSATSGNWVRLQAVSSSMPNGTLLVYATDASGKLIGRNGQTGAGVTLDDAVLAKIGVVKSDGGADAFDGGQSVYLPVGEQLHFAVDTGDNTIELLPAVKVTGSGDSQSVNVTGSFGSLNLSATIDNTLSPSESLAGSQRGTDQPMVYLTQGETVHLDVAASAFNVNTLHMVRLNVDAAGKWSVGGVAYGNTDAFRAAVQANWDPGVHVTGGHGDFQSSLDWTVSQGSGFYTPVLATQSGDIFVLGNANVDGRDHIRTYGENTFGFEDQRADQHSDFDYNDMIVKITPPH